MIQHFRVRLRQEYSHPDPSRLLTLGEGAGDSQAVRTQIDYLLRTQYPLYIGVCAITLSAECRF
jgi:hypothetical protein